MRKDLVEGAAVPASSISTETLSHSRHSPSPTRPLVDPSSPSQSSSAPRDRLAECMASGAKPTSPTTFCGGRAAFGSDTTDAEFPNPTSALHELNVQIPYNTDTVLDPNIHDGSLSALHCHVNPPTQSGEPQRQRDSRSSDDEDGSSSGGGGGRGLQVMLNPRTTVLDSCGGHASDREPEPATNSKQLRIAHSPNTFRSYSNL